MPHQIGNAFVSAIESVELSVSTQSEEIDLTDKDKQFLVEAENSGEEVDITFVLVEEDFVLTEENRVSDLNELTTRDASQNDVVYDGGIIGMISVDSVSIPKSSSEDGIRRGTISGKLLSWPRNFPGEPEPSQEPLGSLYSSGGYGDGIYGIDVSPGDYGYRLYGESGYGDY